MKNPIELKAQIQKEFENKSVSEINRFIFVVKLINLLNNKSFLFFYPFIILNIVFLLQGGYSFGVLIASIIIHLLYHHFVVKKVMYKDIEEKRTRSLYIIKYLNELKNQ